MKGRVNRYGGTKTAELPESRPTRAALSPGRASGSVAQSDLDDLSPGENRHILRDDQRHSARARADGDRSLWAPLCADGARSGHSAGNAAAPRRTAATRSA